jgi:hypothetical protein
MRITEVKTFISKIFQIIKQEVKDDKTQASVFNRMANEIRASQLYKEKGIDDESNPQDS